MRTGAVIPCRGFVLLRRGTVRAFTFTFLSATAGPENDATLASHATKTGSSVTIAVRVLVGLEKTVHVYGSAFGQELTTVLCVPTKDSNGNEGGLLSVREAAVNGHSEPAHATTAF